jgi:hypothetical protein
MINEWWHEKEMSEYEWMSFENMHANFIKSTSQKYIFKNKQHLARKKLQLEMKSLMILGMSFLVDPPTFRRCYWKFLCLSR